MRSSIDQKNAPPKALINLNDSNSPKSFLTPCLCAQRYNSILAFCRISQIQLAQDDTGWGGYKYTEYRGQSKETTSMYFCCKGGQLGDI